MPVAQIPSIFSREYDAPTPDASVYGEGVVRDCSPRVDERLHHRLSTRSAAGGALAIGRAEATDPNHRCEDHRGHAKHADVKRLDHLTHTLASPSWLGCKCLVGPTEDWNLKMAAPSAPPYHGIGGQGGTICSLMTRLQWQQQHS